jgi:hypothetical protein
LEQIREGFRRRDLEEIRHGFELAANDFRHGWFRFFVIITFCHIYILCFCRTHTDTEAFAARVKQKASEVGQRIRYIFSFDEVDSFFQHNRKISEASSIDNRL